jgi:hypothetical protein
VSEVSEVALRVDFRALMPYLKDIEGFMPIPNASPIQLGKFADGHGDPSPRLSEPT